MKKFVYLDEKTVELAGVAASVAGGCRLALIIILKKPWRWGVLMSKLAKSLNLER